MPLSEEDMEFVGKQIKERIEHLSSSPETKAAIKAITNRITLLFIIISALLSVIWYETRATRNISFDNSVAIARLEGVKNAKNDPLTFSLR